MARAKVVAVHDTPDGPRYDVEIGGKVTRGVALPPPPVGKTAPSESEKKGGGGKAAEPAMVAAVAWLQHDLDGGVVTVNEYRASKGLQPDERFGNKTLPEFIAANAATYKAMAQARSVGDAAPPPPTPEPTKRAPARKVGDRG